MTRNKYRPPVNREPVPTPGLSPESVAALSPEAVSARVSAREAREAASARRYAAGLLADRVNAATPPVRPRPARGTAPTPNGAQAPRPEPGTHSSGDGDAEPPRRKPWTGATIGLPRSTEPTPPTFTDADAAALLGLLNSAPHRQGESADRLDFRARTTTGPRPVTDRRNHA